MANLKVCYELTPSELKTTHICPHCHYNLGDQVPNVAGQLDNLDIRIDDLVTEWTQTPLNTISDPIVASQKEYLSVEQQKAIDDFIASGTLPKRVDDFFIKAIQALLKGFEPVVVDAKVKTAQYRAAVHANADMLLLYYDIGCVINEHKAWGNKFVDNLATDIRIAFPESKGYSVRNLKYMAKFAETYPNREFVQQVVAQIPWGHNIVLLDKIADPNEREWYLEKSAQNGWSRNVLVHQIESGLYQRQVLADKVTNFERRLPSPQSELAVQTMKDPYVFDFIPFREDMLERDIEQALVRDVTKLLLELGTGFAFLGNQYHLNVGGDDFYIDLLFYNLNLRCYVVVELKTGEFKPEYAGQLNFYLSAVDGILKKEQDNPSIGLLLCKSKNNVVAEYSLKDISKPIGVSEYKVTSSLPDDLEKQLPSVEDIQKRIK